MTVQDLLAVIDQIITERLKVVLQNTSPSAIPAEKLNADEWWRTMISDIIVPASNTPSPSALILEERHQWYKPL